MTDTFDRTQLDGKDRGQLSEIAAALGVKSVSRMRKAELVDAIVSAAKGSAGVGRHQRFGAGASAQDPLDRFGRRRPGGPRGRGRLVGVVRHAGRRHGGPAPLHGEHRDEARGPGDRAGGARATPTTRPAIHTTTPATTRPTTAARARSRGATTTVRAIAGAGAGGAEIATVPTAVSNASRARSSPASC